ncbi:MAG: carboxylesterase family protein [Leptolyngbyaceae cyanobacterium MO_188.B28]|nr:carboxylesterase family protein [Leptolyngbyaceae cyanobacterium MO_188.B28]
MNSPFLQHKYRAISVAIALSVSIAVPLIGIFRPTLSTLAALPLAGAPEPELEWANTPQVDTAQGSIDGILRTITTLDEQTVPVYAWLGIPYVKNPATEAEKTAMRWAAPHPPEPWSVVLDTKTRKPPCLQIPVRQAFDLDGQIHGDEDCRYANVWRPQTSETDLPIYVDIHGGGNVLGTGHDLAHLAAAHNAVTISFNYRLGLFSQLRAPGLETGDPLGDSGNFSMLDMLKLLEWVQQNAPAFGGDPNQVTLGGYSAGAGYTWALLTSPAAQGRNLFHRAIIQSGPLGNQIFTVEQNYETSRRLLAHYLYQNDSALSFLAANFRATQLHLKGESGSILRSIKPVTLLCLVNQARAAEWPDQCGELRPLPPGVSNFFQFLPTSDGEVQPLISQEQALKNGDFVQVPVLIGATQQESKYFMVLLWVSPDEATQQWQGLPSREQFNTLFTQFDPDHPTQPLPGIGVPTVDFILPNGWTARRYERNQRWASSIATRQLVDRGANAVQPHVPIFAYQFRWKRQPAPFNTILGATHGVDLPFWRQTFESESDEDLIQAVGFSQANEPGRVELAQQMGVFFRNFLYTGDPNQGEQPPTDWMQWSNAPFNRRLYLDATDNAAQLRMGP